MLRRRELLQRGLFLGLGLGLGSPLFQACGDPSPEPIKVNFSGKVLIVGAGASGLMAAYTLQKYNIDYQVIEAHSMFGGRLKKASDFGDVPIDLGAEWLHDEPRTLSNLINDPANKNAVQLIPYNPDQIYTWDGENLHNHNWANSFYAEYKFKQSWYDFFADNIVAPLKTPIVYNSPVTEIDYSSSKVRVKTVKGDVYEGDKVLVTVSLAILQSKAISFSPALPNDAITAIDRTEMPGGLKVFIEFSEQFYPDIVLNGSLLGDNSQEKIYYNAVFKKDSKKHILGLFTVGEPAEQFLKLPNNEAIYKAVMQELDQMFNNRASQTYVKHVIQNWSAEPYIKGSYSYHDDTSEEALKAALLKPHNNRLFFAGEALAPSATSTVHGAGFSGVAACRTILAG